MKNKIYDFPFPDAGIELPRFEFIDVPILEIETDTRYQRPVQAAHVDKIAKNFDIEKYRPITGNRRDGKVYVVDGLQRLTVLKMLGCKGNVQVYVPVKSLTFEQECKWFYAYNMENKKLTHIDGYNAQVGGGDPIMVAVQEVILPFNLRISTAKEKGCIQAIAALCMVITDVGGQEALNTTVDALLSAYENALLPSYEVITRPMVLGVATFIKGTDEKYFDFNILVETLQERTPREWATVEGARGTKQVIVGVTKELRIQYFEKFQGAFGCPGDIGELDN